MEITPQDLAQTMQWADLVEELTHNGDIEANVILAVIYIESRGDPNAINKKSKATGLMQIMPQEAGPVFDDRPTSEELLNPTVNITWGIKILHYFMGKEGSLWGGLYRYSGGKTWPSYGDFITRYWKPFSEVREAIQGELDKKWLEEARQRDARL